MFLYRFSKSILLIKANHSFFTVTFKPVEGIEYNDTMEFVTLDDVRFAVKLSATLPKPKLEYPEFLTYGVCPVGMLSANFIDLFG